MSHLGSRAAGALAVLAATGLPVPGALGTVGAQDTTGSGRVFLLEGRVGTTEALGATTRRLVGPDAAVGVTFAFQLSPRSWGWVSADYKPWNSSVLYPGPGMSPGIGLYTLTAGLSRTFGFPFVRRRWRPFELGLGVGATQAEFQSTAQSRGTDLPPDAQFEDLFDSELFSFKRWRPTAAGRLRVSLPIGRFVDLSGTAGVLATHVGNVRLWNGEWEPTGEGNLYRPSSRTWAFGPIVTVPLTLGFGLKF